MDRTCKLFGTELWPSCVCSVCAVAERQHHAGPSSPQWGNYATPCDPARCFGPTVARPIHPTRLASCRPTAPRTRMSRLVVGGWRGNHLGRLPEHRRPPGDHALLPRSRVPMNCARIPGSGLRSRRTNRTAWLSRPCSPCNPASAHAPLFPLPPNAGALSPHTSPASRPTSPSRAGKVPACNSAPPDRGQGHSRRRGGPTLWALPAAFTPRRGRQPTGANTPHLLNTKAC